MSDCNILIIFAEDVLNVRVDEGIFGSPAYYENGVFYASLEPLDSATRCEEIIIIFKYNIS